MSIDRTAKTFLSSRVVAVTSFVIGLSYVLVLLSLNLRDQESRTDRVPSPYIHAAGNYDTCAINFCGHMSYTQFDTMAVRAGTGKSSIAHNYSRHYVNYFEKYRLQPIRLLEIGIHDGSSVRLWEDYFPLAELHFIDITAKNIRYKSARSHYHFLSQTDVKVLTALAKRVGPFDIVIDDGGHRPEHIITSFKTLFPFVRSGGMYVVEDLQTQYLKEWGGHGDMQNPKTGPGTAITFLKNLVDDVNYKAVVTAMAGDNRPVTGEPLKRMSRFSKRIDSIHFYGAICFMSYK